MDKEGGQAAPKASKDVQGDTSRIGQPGWAALHSKTHLSWVQGQPSLECQV